MNNTHSNNTTMTTRQAILDTFRELGPCGLRPVVETLELDHAEAKVIVEQLIQDRHLYQQSNKQYTVKCPREQQPLRKKSRASYEERSASDKQLQSLNEHLSELGAPDVKPVIARARQFMDYQAAQLRQRPTATQPKPVADCTITELAEQLQQHRDAIKEIHSHVKPLLD